MLTLSFHSHFFSLKSFILHHMKKRVWDDYYILIHIWRIHNEKRWKRGIWKIWLTNVDKQIYHSLTKLSLSSFVSYKVTTHKGFMKCLVKPIENCNILKIPALKIPTTILHWSHIYFNPPSAPISYSLYLFQWYILLP